MQTNPAVEQNNNIKWSVSPWNQISPVGSNVSELWSPKQIRRVSNGWPTSSQNLV